MLILLITRSDVPVFETVTVLGEDVLPTRTEPKLTDVGETEILGGGALPEIFTFRVGFLGSLEGILNIALFLPKGSVGLNVPVIVHAPPAGIVVQSFV